MTDQELFGSYGEDAGLLIAIDLVNELAIDHAFGRPRPQPATTSGPSTTAPPAAATSPADRFDAIHRILQIDPPTAALLTEADVPGFVGLATQLRAVFADLDRDEVDAAAAQVNDLLATHPAHPHLAKENGRWRLHHHPVDAALVPMMAASCAEGLARVIGADAHDRLGTCGSDGCDRVFYDSSKNGSRRFCSTTCQNRVKAAAFRRRRAAGEGPSGG